MDRTDQPAPTGPPPQRIRELFAGVAHRYDLANTVLSLGIHHRWRRALVRWSGIGPGAAVLDCAAGTGDLALACSRIADPGGLVVAGDFCLPMLQRAPAKATRAGRTIHPVQADALALPHPNDAFDLATIAFGIRNVADPVAGIAEMARVVRPGGLVMVLEFGQVRAPLLGPLYRLFSRRVLPAVGRLLTGHRTAYRYLEESSARFPCGEAFRELMASTGAFERVEHRPLTAGIAYLYRGVVAG